MSQSIPVHSKSGHHTISKLWWFSRHNAGHPWRSTSTFSTNSFILPLCGLSTDSRCLLGHLRNGWHAPYGHRAILQLVGCLSKGPLCFTCQTTSYLAGPTGASIHNRICVWMSNRYRVSSLGGLVTACRC